MMGFGMVGALDLGTACTRNAASTYALLKIVVREGMVGIVTKE